MNGHILVVEDDDTIAQVLGDYLRRAGFTVDHSADGSLAPGVARDRRPDLVVLDLMLPGCDGLEVCRLLRADAPDLPVIILTALTQEQDRVVGFEAGADDYVTKPFSPREMVLRIESVLRRARRTPSGPPDASVEAGPVRVDPASRTATCRGRALELTAREFDLLTFLVRHPGQVFSRAQLLDQVWGWSFGDQSTVTVHVRRLREKVETDPADPQLVLTVWGVGYRFDPTGEDATGGEQS